MKRHRRQFSADWKAKVALEAIKGQRTIQEIASHYEIHPNLVTHWKKELLERAAEIFSSGKTQEGKADEELKAELYQQIGKLQVEVDWLKKKSGLSR
jgi:transposase-like protein